MTILNEDGTPFHVTSKVRAFDPSDPTYQLLNIWDEESIKRGGSPIFIYEVFIAQSQIDNLYNESRSKVWSQFPVECWCTYEPVPSMNELGLFGIDGGTAEMVFEFNYKTLLEKLGHPPKIGSRLFTPHLREHWELLQCNTGEYKGWNVIRLQMICRKYQDSLTNSDSQVSHASPGYPIIQPQTPKPTPGYTIT